MTVGHNEASNIDENTMCSSTCKFYSDWSNVNHMPRLVYFIVNTI